MVFTMDMTRTADPVYSLHLAPGVACGLNQQLLQLGL
jgi:hypothetical protein